MIRGKSKGCPYNLPIPFGCMTAGNCISMMQDIEDEEDADTDINTGVLTKLTFTAGDAASLDTLHIKETSILRTSLNVPIDILERVYGLIEVIE